MPKTPILVEFRCVFQPALKCTSDLGFGRGRDPSCSAAIRVRLLALQMRRAHKAGVSSQRTTVASSVIKKFKRMAHAGRRGDQHQTSRFMSSRTCWTFARPATLPHAFMLIMGTFKRWVLRTSLVSALSFLSLDVLFCGCSSTLPSAQDMDHWHQEAEAIRTAFEYDFLHSQAVRDAMAIRSGKHIKVTCIRDAIWIEASWPAGKTVSKDSHGREVVTCQFEQRLTNEEVAALAAEARRLIVLKHLNACAVLVDARIPDKKVESAATITRGGHSLRLRSNH